MLMVAWDIADARLQESLTTRCENKLNTKHVRAILEDYTEVMALHGATLPQPHPVMGMA